MKKVVSRAVRKVLGPFSVVSKNTDVRRWDDDKKCWGWEPAIIHSVYGYRNRMPVAETESKIAAEKICQFLNAMHENDTPGTISEVIDAFAWPVENRMALSALAPSAERERYYNAGRVGHRFGD